MSHTLDLVKPKSSEELTHSVRPTTLDGPRKSIRPNLFKPNAWKASLVTLIGFTFQILSYALIYYSLVTNQNALLVLGWFLCGMSVTSLFVIGHDCAHASFLKSNTINDIIGHICFLFSFYPYYGWKFSHNAHHAHTNDLTTHTEDVYFDNAWVPFTVAEYLALKEESRLHAFIYKCTRYFPPIGSVLHNIVCHAFPSKFIESHRTKLYFSYGILSIGLILVGGTLSLLVGNWTAIFHFLIIPGLIFQFWMSYYTFLHHTSSEIKFYKKEEWTPYLGQIVSTYNFLNPKWLSFLHFHIDIHTPHHLSTAIPCYNLKEAYSDLKKSDYARDLKEGEFKIGYLFHQLKECHVWDVDAKKYRRFRDIEG
jgi:omega-6 fatty acid desaturase (delta-12 desaturase)